MTLTISEVLDRKIKKFLKDENRRFIDFIRGLDISLEEFEANLDYYVALYEENKEDQDRAVAVLFLLIVQFFLEDIKKELKRLDLYTKTLLQQIEQDLLSSSAVLLTEFKAELDKTTEDTYTRVLRKVLSESGDIEDLETFFKKYSKIVDKFSDFHSIQLNNIFL